MARAKRKPKRQQRFYVKTVIDLCPKAHVKVQYFVQIPAVLNGGQTTAKSSKNNLDFSGYQRVNGMLRRQPMNVIEIPAKPKEEKIIRVAAYARVSADKDAAFHSLEAQTEYYEEYVRSHPGWELVGIYSDNAISGTTVNRPEFQRMLTDCRAGKIDLIVTKSITRFARNTVDLLKTTRELKDLEIDCFFEKENMHSISPDGEFFLTLLAMYAEEEARSASENQKWRVKRKFEAGEPWVGKMLGYRLVDGKITVVPEEAEIVRQIFTDYLSGMGRNAIAKKLILQGVETENGNTWSSFSIRKILRNENYVGDLLLQKTYVKDFRTKKRVDNHGEVRQYLVKDDHEPIIDRETFNRVQEEATQRAIKYNSPPKNTDGDIPLFRGLIRCGYCGRKFFRKKANRGYNLMSWICPTFYDVGKSVCPSQKIPDQILVEQTKIVLQAEELTREMLIKLLSEIVVPEHNHLIYVFTDGTEKEVIWKHPSRSLSWTPEMRQQVREKNLARSRKEKNHE